MTFFSVYAPTLHNNVESCMAFYHNLRSVINSILNADKILVSYFNVRVGREHETAGWRVSDTGLVQTKSDRSGRMLI